MNNDLGLGLLEVGDEVLTVTAARGMGLMLMKGLELLDREESSLTAMFQILVRLILQGATYTSSLE